MSTVLEKESCVKSNIPLDTTPIQSLEVCTLAVAKKLKIDDPKDYFIKGYENTKTNNTTFDKNSATDRYESLCRKDPKQEVSYPNCILHFGMGYASKPNDPSKCIPFECPPGFTPDKNGCIKPESISSSRLKKEFCNERWYDWFMVPNYQLGNKYIKLDGKCYQPCNPGFVPSFGTDPVDGYSPGLGTTDHPEMCANKDTYLGGKYNTPQNYCPLAAIKRLSSTRESLKRDYENVILNKYKEVDEDYEKLDTVTKKNIDSNIKQEVDDMITSIHSKLEDIYPASQNDIVACRTLIDDNRVGEAYNTCKLLDENADYYLTNMQEDGVSLPTAQLKVNLLKKACHSLFCNKNDNPIASVSNTVYTGADGTETIIDPDKTFCFPDAANDKDIQALVQNNNKSGASKVNSGNSKPTSTKSFVDIYKDLKFPIYGDVTDKMILSVKIIPNIIAIVILIYVIYVFFKYTEIGQWLLKKIKDILFSIWAFLSCLEVTRTKTV